MGNSMGWEAINKAKNYTINNITVHDPSTPISIKFMPRDLFLKHLDRIMGYDQLQQRIDELTGKIKLGTEEMTIHSDSSISHHGAHHGAATCGAATVEFDIYPMVLEMLSIMDDCLNTPYVNTLDWEMTSRPTPEMLDINNSEFTTRLISAWALEMEYGSGQTKIKDIGTGKEHNFSSADDLYDYLRDEVFGVEFKEVQDEYSQDEEPKAKLSDKNSDILEIPIPTGLCPSSIPAMINKSILESNE